jgi:hypothetical protein
MDRFEIIIRELTQPINGQYPRPWMTDLVDPLSANIFVVGKNQRHGYRVEHVGSHDRYIDSLFNRNGQSCRALYNEITGGRPSPTRKNIDKLTERLQRRDAPDVLETNVICYSSPMSADLKHAGHVGGRERGQAIFRTLLELIRPRVLIGHGKDTCRLLAKVLKSSLPAVLEMDGEPPAASVSGPLFEGTVIVVQSLAPPGYNKWASWASLHLDKVADRAAVELGSQ